MFQIIAYPKQIGFLEENAEPAELADRESPVWASQVELKSIYMQAVEAYQRELTSPYPQLKISHNTDDDDDDIIVFDEQLYTTLFDIYVVEGWKGLQNVEAALLERAPERDEGVLPGGTQRSPWRPVKQFFYITRNLLVLLIRDALFTIERAAAQDIYVRLNDTAAVVEEAWTGQFKFVTLESSPAPRLQRIGGEVSIETSLPVTTFEMGVGAKELADSLFAAMTEAVEQKLLFEGALQRLPDVKKNLEQTRAKAHGSNVPYDVAEQSSKVQKLELEVATLQRVDQQAKSLYSSAHKLIRMKCPLALLVLDSLKQGFLKHQMEDKLGKILDMLRKKNDKLAGVIDPSKSYSAACLGAIGLTSGMGLHGLKPSMIPSEGLEVWVIEKGMSGILNDPGWFPLLNEATLHRLTQSGEIAEDSFEYVVCFHYVSMLMGRIEELRARQAANQAFGKSIGGLAAAVSLALFLTPAATVAVPARVVAYAVDLAIMAHVVHSVVDELAQYDKGLSEALIQPEAFGVAALARIGELVSMRAELVDNLVLHVALEAVLGLTPARFFVLRKLLLARSYYQDVEMLLGNG
ncbi:MAG: hypothetical protein LH470_09560 [Lysobacter sp.]|nr:hypothetical protein [Lysobacter sp.]